MDLPVLGWHGYFDFVSLGGIFFLLLWCFLLLLVRKVLLFHITFQLYGSLHCFCVILYGVEGFSTFVYEKLLIVVRLPETVLDLRDGCGKFKPLVSVIILIYCEEAFHFKSVVNQHFEYGAIESIVVDSHSPDRTREVAKRSADKVIDLLPWRRQSL